MKGLVDIGRQRKLLILCLFIGNVAADCENPTNRVHIEITAESLKIKEFPDGTVINYKCKLGYIRVNGTGEMTCVNRRWTEPDITCRPMDCGPVKPQPHMILDVSQGTLFGASVYMSCEKGYELYGSDIKHCFHTGWFGVGNCVYVTCSIPSIGNGTHTWTSHREPEYKQTINFTCNPGYNLRGSKTITCNRRGKYDPKPPKCIAVTCFTPDEVENGRHSWNSDLEPEYRQTIRFTCNTGYNLVGNKTIRCTETGEYNSQPPRCVLVTCPKPTRVENGRHSWNNVRKPEYRQTIHYTCNTGYNLVGNKIIRCTETGGYDSQPPQCVVVTCPKLTRVENGRHSWISGHNPQYRQTIHYTCNTGYNLVGNEIIECTETGEYDSQPPQCVIVTCPKPTRVENGRHSWNNVRKPEYRQTIHFTCNTGYNLVGNKIIRCTVTGEYDSQPPRCVVVTCPKPTRVGNGRHSWNNDLEPEYQQTIRFTCNTGYNLVGNETIRCTETGGYDSQPPQCVIVTCPKPTRVENGRHSWNSVRKPEYQQTIRFTCNTGYTLFGNEIIRCTETGGYDSQQPRCVTDCPKPQHIENTVLSAESLRKRIFPSGTVIKYECMKGSDQISGTGIIRCVSGKWTKPDIICKRSDCGLPEAKPHMSFDTSQGTIIGAVATVICEEGYRVSGSRSKQCMDEGWFGIADCICNCPIPKSVENMVLTNESLLREDFPDGTKVTYECANGFEKESGSEIITCIDGTWTESDLICKEIKPPLNLLLIGVAVGCSLALLFCILWVWRRCSDNSEG
ncbi:sushi, von Willebrand factor type A, EGF and pentraxin domain-containing protein 1-like isoform X2 [Poeciliopsis prolifica]|uniref:sushi, von Willebrand factor type A, EGF and pentraxin domain-containing protein 1-like isoform X2 n=1 Tax=Poeciliopsis prolifica TaxID=188132 RepID=UPI0024138F54|nr:sushi, von Willebrand factor type A, EGF and pentraxin domain-containing protein 1-like isoform X2 [Poeciliopsis prolifica]